MSRTAALAGACLTLVAAGLAHGQTAPAPRRPTVVHSLLVQPKPPVAALRQQARTFVAALTAGPDSESLIRWDQRLCPLVAGLPAEQAEAVLQRLSDDVRAAGAPLGPRNCHANLYIVIAAEPNRLLAEWRRRDSGLFGDGQPPLIRRFATSTAPVRVWYDTQMQGADGMAPSTDQTAYAGEPQVSVQSASRLQLQTVRGLSAVVVLGEAKLVNGVTTRQLADYVAMAALTRVNPDAALGDAPTILKLFDGKPADAREGLTDLDEAFLRGLYRSDQSSVMQRDEIVHAVTDAATR